MGHPEPETNQPTTPLKPKEGLNGPPEHEWWAAPALGLRLEVSCWAVYGNCAPDETERGEHA